MKTTRDSIGSLLESLSEQVRDLFPPALALILTGSTARGEQSVVERDGSIHWLSDLELLVVVPDAMPLPQLRRQLAAAATRINADLRAQGCDAAVELTTAPERYFRTLTPHVFSFELRTHGRQLFGDHRYLADIPPFEASAIPLEDAWRLVSNRMVEWLDHLAGPLREPEWEAYLIAKQYTDLVTSLSLFAGTYTATYQGRHDRLPELANFLRSTRLEEVLARHGFQEAAARSIGYRLNPAPMCGLDGGWIAMKNALPTLLTSVWRWELERLSSRPSEDSARALAAARRVYRLRGRLRGWARFWVSLPFARLAPHVLRHARLFPAGSPRSLIYTSAAELLEASGSRDDRACLARVARMLPLPAAGGDWGSLVSQCVWHWKKVLRMSRA
jgi:hypothetical protein